MNEKKVKDENENSKTTQTTIVFSQVDGETGWPNSCITLDRLF